MRVCGPACPSTRKRNAPNDMFTEMRLALASQHTMLMVRKAAGEENLPGMPHTCRSL
jgi:hypothetical protein